ncbi:hypothetical protein DT73_05185 [Mangrovibacter sp. MFB070]|uniref:YraN family protein n=1 Tax=Mangrovibacter sp. MFB070 TaxID=1224318 RepID=UPI0004DA4BAB|nr:YraN family protein [Mangrovibacter sp. MFB070]KEA53735.1 hypothetical protein DT73_05185 [Mangrovibacter sp. MFB070]
MAYVPTRKRGSCQLSATQQKGALWEQRARRWLEQQGLHFIAANVRFGRGEIDLIMKQGGCLVFIEVRYRQSALYGGAQASITRQKRRKLLQTANLWLAQQNQSFDTVDCRFDVLAFTNDRAEWIPNAFSACDN